MNRLLGRASAFLTIVGLYVGLASAMSIAGNAPAAQAATAKVFIYNEAGKPRALYRPVQFYFTENDLGAGFHWSKWTSTTAVGTGTDHSCAQGQCRPPHRVTLTYGDPKVMCGLRTFTLLESGNKPIATLSQVGSICMWQFV